MSNALFTQQRADNGDALFNPQVVFVTELSALLSTNSNISAQVRDSVTYLYANLQARANIQANLRLAVTTLAANLSVSTTLTARLTQPSVLKATLQVSSGITANLVVPIQLAAQMSVNSAIVADLKTTASTGLPRGLRIVARPTGCDESQLVRYRGDNYADEFEVILERDGEPVNINGCTFVMSVANDKNPVANEPLVYQVFGQVTDAPKGLVEFAPTANQTDMVGFYYYDVQMQDSTGIIRTLIADSYVFKPDITR